MSEPDASHLLTVAEAIAEIDALDVSPRRITMRLSEAAGLHLAADVAADRDYPPFDKSLMDGYAIRSADLVGKSKTFASRGIIAAGMWPTELVKAGQTMQIMTGAPMPPGADGVVPVEQSQADGDSERVILQTIDHPDKFVLKRGAEVRAGQVVLHAGQRLGPAQLAVAASVGAAMVSVLDRPRVGMLGTGDEIVSLDDQPGPAQIRGCNNVMLASLLQRLGCDVTDMGVIPDQPAAVRGALEQGCGYDAFFVTGGMSMGEFDYIPRTLLDMGASMKVTKLRIKPGKPFVVATLGSTVVFGLPGNPVSAFVCTLRLASRLIARLRGGCPEPVWRYGTLAAALPANGPREFYQPARFDGKTVHPLAWKGSADVFTLSAADVLIVRPESAPAVAAGEMVQLLEVPR
jgi:molybdopterin molybdotransferase